MRKYWRVILSRAPLPMLALAASYGVYQYALLFTPQWVAIVQAAAFEATYLGLSVVEVDDQQRRRAALVSIGAVLTSIIYNSLAGWFHRAPQLLDGASDIAWLALATLHGAPLAWVAFLVASLLLHSPAPSAQPSAINTQPNATIDAIDVQPLPGYEHDVLYLRDELGLGWGDIGVRLGGISRQAASIRYQRAKKEQLVMQGGNHA
jgi:hypothetical protein